MHEEFSVGRIKSVAKRTLQRILVAHAIPVIPFVPEKVTVFQDPCKLVDASGATISFENDFLVVTQLPVVLYHVS